MKNYYNLIGRIEKLEEEVDRLQRIVTGLIDIMKLDAKRDFELARDALVRLRKSAKPKPRRRRR
jgi:hypothetical protein